MEEKTMGHVYVDLTAGLNKPKMLTDGKPL